MKARALLFALSCPLFAAEALAQDAVVLKNDHFVDAGGQAYLQQGFVEGEMAGVWLQVPAAYPMFKVDSFRVLMGDAAGGQGSQQIFFRMGVAASQSPTIPADIENAAQITTGPFFNDVPAQDVQGRTLCARAGEYIGAALEFTHSGAPSVYRDVGPIVVQNNTLYAIPGGWTYSVSLGLRGNWILRVVGHAAAEGECG